MKRDLELAEQQMCGFTAALNGEDIISLAEAMDLTGDEWEELKPQCTYMHQANIDALDEHFEED